MSSVISRDRVAEQFRVAADVVLALTDQDDGEGADCLAAMPAGVTADEESLMAGAPCGDRSGEVVHALVAKLAAHGLDACVLDPGDGWHLAITSVGCARCELAVDDDGSVRWEYRPATGRDTDPAEMTRLVLRLLAADDSGCIDAHVSAQPGVTLKGLVGRALDACGLAVRMLVYEDPIFYDVTAEIVVTSPVRPDRGQVRLTDGAAITWELPCRPAASGDAEDTADAVASGIAQAIALSRSRYGESKTAQVS